MRLLNIKTYRLETFQKWEDTPPYAILSHTWGKDEIMFGDLAPAQPSLEVQALQDKLRDLERRLVEYDSAKFGSSERPTSALDPFQRARAKAAWPKLEGARLEAQALGLSHVWIDTCCIDQSSSTEMSESINSMFAWYRDCKVCLAYLGDVESKEDWEPKQKEEHAMASHWFDRGWTLQELLAPRDVLFYSRSWRFLGQRSLLADPISQRTGIDSVVLREGNMGQISRFSVAQRLSWAARRVTTREEDRAYSLLGLFGVVMPVIYGEGEQNAFLRLQKEIYAETRDQSIFAWVDPMRENKVQMKKAVSISLSMEAAASTANWSTRSTRYRRNLPRSSVEDVESIYAPSVDFFRSASFVLDSRDTLEAWLETYASCKIPRLREAEQFHTTGPSVPLLMEKLKDCDPGGVIYLAFLACLQRGQQGVVAVYLLSKGPGRYVRLSPGERLSIPFNAFMLPVLRLEQVYAERPQREFVARPRLLDTSYAMMGGYSFGVDVMGFIGTSYNLTEIYPPQWMWQKNSMTNYDVSLSLANGDLPTVLKVSSTTGTFCVRIEINKSSRLHKLHYNFFASVVDLTAKTTGALETVQNWEDMGKFLPKVDLSDRILATSLTNGDTLILSLSQKRQRGDVCLNFNIKNKKR